MADDLQRAKKDLAQLTRQVWQPRVPAITTYTSSNTEGWQQGMGMISESANVTLSAKTPGTYSSASDIVGKG